MQKGYKRSGRGMAVLRFFIGLIVIAILVCVAYFFIAKVDYTDKLANPDASMRPYVEMTADQQSSVPVQDEVIQEPGQIEVTPVQNSVVNQAEPEQQNADFVDVSTTPEPTATPTPVPTPTPTPEPTAIPTPSPVPTPTPTPTPEPTKIATKKCASAKKSGFNVPEPSDTANVALTNFYVSEPNNKQIIQFNGYGYINNETFDGDGTQAYMVVTQKHSGTQVAYKATMKAGVSGADHSAAQCQNAAETDFQLFINVKSYEDGDYGLGLVLYYELDGNTVYSYHELEENFTVKDGAVSQSAGGFGAFSAN